MADHDGFRASPKITEARTTMQHGTLKSASANTMVSIEPFATAFGMHSAMPANPGQVPSHNIRRR